MVEEIIHCVYGNLFLRDIDYLPIWTYLVVDV